jgi:signal transduction histidine kinase
MTVVQGYAESLARSLDDPDLRDRAATISSAGGRLLSIGEKVREFDRIQNQVNPPERVDLGAMISELRQTLLSEFPNAEIRADISTSDAEVHTRPEVLELALTNLVENAVKHGSAAEPTVHLQVRTAQREGTVAIIDVRDNNTQIPESEISVLRTGAETPLEHGQGIGLWVVNWCLTTLNGEFEYRYDGGNHFEIILPVE